SSRIVTNQLISGIGIRAIAHNQFESIKLLTGVGNDLVSYSAVQAPGGVDVTVDTGSGHDLLVFHGTPKNDQILIGESDTPDGPQAIFNLNGQDSVNHYLNGEVIVVLAGSGNDRVVMDDSAGLKWGAEFLGQDGDDLLIGNEQADYLSGGNGFNILVGAG